MLDKNKVRLGIAPIAWTNDDMPDLGKENIKTTTSCYRNYIIRKGI